MARPSLKTGTCSFSDVIMHVHAMLHAVLKSGANSKLNVVLALCSPFIHQLLSIRLAFNVRLVA